MKKLLSLLSVLTISGSAVPTTIAASPYQKEEKNIQTNNLRERMELDSNKEKRQIGVGEAIGAASAVIGIIDSYKNDGVAKDVVDAINNSVIQGETDRANSIWISNGGFGGDGSY